MKDWLVEQMVAVPLVLLVFSDEIHLNSGFFFLLFVPLTLLRWIHCVLQQQVRSSAQRLWHSGFVEFFFFSQRRKDQIRKSLCLF